MFPNLGDPPKIQEESITSNSNQFSYVETHFKAKSKWFQGKWGVQIQVQPRKVTCNPNRVRSKLGQIKPSENQFRIKSVKRKSMSIPKSQISITHSEVSKVMGVPPVIIHFGLGCSIINHPASLGALETPISQKTSTSRVKHQPGSGLGAVCSFRVHKIFFFQMKPLAAYNFHVAGNKKTWKDIGLGLNMRNIQSFEDGWFWWWKNETPVNQPK